MTETYKQLTIPEAIEALQAIVDANPAPVVQSTVTKAKGKRGKGARVTVQTISIPSNLGKCTQVYHG
jgi:predicted secreted protein